MRFVLRAATLAAYAVLMAGCGSSSPSTSPTTPTPTPGGTPTGLTIAMPQGATGLTTTAYVPNPATISVGSTVTWVNNDVDPHTSTSTTNVFASPTIPPGGSFSFTFQSRGSFNYFCQIHPNMVGRIDVQ
jgi:plastocyanin